MDRLNCLRAAWLRLLKNDVERLEKDTQVMQTKWEDMQAKWKKLVVQHKLHGTIAIWGYTLPILSEADDTALDASQLNVFEKLLATFLKKREGGIRKKIEILRSITRGTIVQVQEAQGKEVYLKNIGDTLDREARNARARHDELHTMLKKALSEKEAVQTRYDRLAETLQTLQAQNDTLQAQQREYSALKTEHTCLQTTHDALQAKYDALTTVHTALQTTHTALQTTHDALTTEHTALQTTHDALHTTHDNLQSTYDALLLQIQNDTQARYAKKLKQLESKLEYAHNKFQTTIDKYGSSTSSQYKECHRRIVADIENRIRKHKAKGPT